MVFANAFAAREAGRTVAVVLGERPLDQRMTTVTTIIAGLPEAPWCLTHTGDPKMTTCQNRRPRALAAVLVTVVAFTACQRTDDRAAAKDSAGMMPPADSAAGMSGMAGMAGMSGMAGMGGMMDTAMMDSMQAHMRMMDTTSAARMKEMLPMHRQMAADMLSRMSSEMRSMNMPADARWSATADSLRQDLIRMPEMSAGELEAMMPAHHARMMRLMQMHRDMMGRKG